MGKPEIIDIIKNSKPEMETLYGVTKVGLFGSYVREQQRKKATLTSWSPSAAILTCLISLICVNTWRLGSIRRLIS
jgi:hypothetical protein